MLFGSDLESPRILATLFWSATTLLIFLETEALFDRRTAYLAAALFAISRGFVLLDAVANTEAFMLLPSMASLYAFTRGLEPTSPKWLFVAGFGMGVAILTKQIAIFELAALSFVLCVHHIQARSYRDLCVAMLNMAAGSILIAAIVLLPFLATGSFGDFYYANVTYNAIYSGQVGLSSQLHNLYLGSRLFLFAAAPLFAATCVALIAFTKTRTRSEVLVTSWLVASAIGVAAGGRYFPHYYVQLLPVMAMMSACAITRIKWHGLGKNLLFAAAVPLVLFAVASNAPSYMKLTRKLDTWPSQ